MRILMVTDCFVPETNAGAVRAYEHCRRWAEQGASVTVLTSVPNFPSGIAHEGYRNRLWQEEVRDGIRVVRVWTYMAPNRGVMLRSLDFLSFAVTSLVAGLFERPDVIVATSPQLLAALSGCLLALVKRKPWVFEVRDLWPDSVVGVGVLKESILIRALRMMERWLYARATRIVAVTKGISQAIATRCATPGKIGIVYNGVDTGRFVPRDVPAELREKYGLAHSYVAGYIGTLGFSQGLETLLEAAAMMKDDPVRILFVGEGQNGDFLRQRAKALNLDNVDLVGEKEEDALLEHIALCDSVIVPLRSHPVFTTAIPSKTFEAAAMEKPIIVSAHTEAAELVARYGAGVSAEPENPAALASAINRLRQGPELTESAARGGRRLAHDFERTQLADQMLQEIRQAVRQHAGNRYAPAFARSPTEEVSRLG